MLSKLMQWLRGGSDSSAKSEPEAPATAPEPPTMPAEPTVGPSLGDVTEAEPTADEPS